MKIISTPTQQQFHDVQTKAFSEGYKWIGVAGYLDDKWMRSGINTVIYLEDSCVTYGSKDYAKENYPTTPIISAEEYLSTVTTEDLKYAVEKIKEMPNYIYEDWGKMYTYATATTTGNYSTNKSLIEKSMDTIKNAFKSKEAKAFEHFGYGSPDDINDSGLRAFQQFTYATASVDKKEFIKKVVELYLEAVK